MKYMTALMIKRLCRKECFGNKGAIDARTIRSVVEDDVTLNAIATQVNEKAQACSCSTLVMLPLTSAQNSKSIEKRI